MDAIKMKDEEKKGEWLDSDSEDMKKLKKGEWLDSDSEDMKKLKKGEVTPAITRLTTEEHDLQGSLVWRTS
ncbi:hypothetical protein KRP22_009717 [Phytophthora ramorum]|nr:hypothetical protein KRP22_14663 [Phytophthora ramorum]